MSPPRSVRSFEAAIGAGDRPLIIAKSLGTSASAIVARHDLPAEWLTPVLAWPTVVDGLRAGSASRLLDGGTADCMWDGGLARELSRYVREPPGADHCLLVDGPLDGSIATGREVVDAVESLLDDAVRPADG